MAHRRGVRVPNMWRHAALKQNPLCLSTKYDYSDRSNPNGSWRAFTHPPDRYLQVVQVKDSFQSFRFT